ncbi:Ig-like domain-containing protein [Streptomyces sp. NPDC006012]|uniref:Ig-like domain-containing protein n=1 Tax=Streptomyces sp. NPDC006012 TaxID=3364739 RepID=UPI00368DB1B7
MNHRPAQLRSPVALLSCFALLCAALAGIVGFAGRASAAGTTLGSFTLGPATGKISDTLLATSARSSTGCPDPAAGQSANSPWLFVINPVDPTGGKAVAQATAAITNGPDAFTVNLKSPAAPASLETALRGFVPTGSLDGTYTLALLCRSGLSTAANFRAKVQVAGDTWTQLQQQSTALTLDAPDGVAVNGNLKLTATVTPSGAPGSVEFKEGDTSLGTAQVTDGRAELPIKAPAVGGPHTYTAVFTSSDPDAYSNATATDQAGITYILTAEDTKGAPLGDKPTLAIGQSAKITIQGFTPGSTVKVIQESSDAKLPDATADADGAVVDYTFTVPDRSIPGETNVFFAEGGSANNRASFTFVSTDEPSSPPPTDNPDLDVTDADGKALSDNPDLEPGQTVKITARGYTADAAVKVTLADSEATFDDAKANATGTVDKYEFTVPKDIADGDHTLTLAEDKADGHSLDFAFTTGAGSSEPPEPSPSATDTSATDTGGADTGGLSGGGGSGGGSGGGGSMASTGAQAGTIGLASLALLSAGSALVLHMRRKGLLTFGGDTPQHH